MNPKYNYDTEDYEVTVGANVEQVDIYAYANHVHKKFKYIDYCT